MSTKLGFIDGGKTSQEGLSRWVSKLVNATGGVLNQASLAVTAATVPDNTVKIAVGDCVIGDSSPSTSSFLYPGWVTVQESVTIAANASGNPRIDTIVAYVNKAAVSSATSDNPGVLTMLGVAGTAAGSPVPPSAATIQAAVGASNPYIVLANIAVANGFTQIITANITDIRSIVAPTQTGWNQLAPNPTYVSASSFTVDGDWTNILQVGDKLRWFQSAFGYANIVATPTYNAGTGKTTVTLSGGTDFSLTNATIYKVDYSKGENPVGFPAFFANTANSGGFQYMKGKSLIQYGLNQFSSPNGSAAYSTTLTFPVSYVNASYNLSHSGVDSSGFASGGETPFVSYNTKANGSVVLAFVSASNTIAIRTVKTHWRTEGLLV